MIRSAFALRPGRRAGRPRRTKGVTMARATGAAVDGCPQRSSSTLIEYAPTKLDSAKRPRESARGSNWRADVAESRSHPNRQTGRERSFLAILTGFTDPSVNQTAVLLRPRERIRDGV